MTERHWLWLGDHLALDVANTVRVEDGDLVELITTVDDLRSWLAAEPADLRVSPEDIDDATVEAFTTIRDAVLHLLHAAAVRQALPRTALNTVNAAVREHRVSPILIDARLVRYIVGNSDPAAELIGQAAAACVDLLARDDLANLAVCHAPGCGQFFHRARPNQLWCSPGCGNRARVDRHRHRRTKTT